MAEQKPAMPHTLTLKERESLTMSGVSEVVRFDDESVVLRTARGTLVVHGNNLHLKTLSLDGGQVAVDGSIQALVYEQERSDRPGWRRLFQ